MIPRDFYIKVYVKGQEVHVPVTNHYDEYGWPAGTTFAPLPASVQELYEIVTLPQQFLVRKKAPKND